MHLILNNAKCLWESIVEILGRTGAKQIKNNLNIFSRYAETYCFVKGTYFLPLDEQIDHSYLARENIFIGYYQWVPLVLAAQALLFYLPSFIWKAMNFNTGL
jgi:hypothetical protein